VAVVLSTGGDDGIFCPGSLNVSIPYKGDTYFGGAVESYSGVFYTTYEYTAFSGGMWITGSITFSAVDCLIMDTGGIGTTSDFTVDGWGMGT
jgi:hypothetical protein